MLEDGLPYVDGLVLSHPEQLVRLRRECPEAGDTARLAGDPCFDRMLAARPRREWFRRALGVRDGQRLVVLNSTWNPEGFFGDGGGTDVLPTLLPRLAEELPVDEFRLAAVLHPNIWYGHGPGQVRAWLDRARRHGLTLIDPVHGWRQALLAADLVLGDFGAVTYYAAALGTPVLLAASASDRLDPDTPLAAFVREAPRLDPWGSLREQLSGPRSRLRRPNDPAEYVSSAPGGSAALLRTLFYGLLELPEPEGDASLEPLPLPPYTPPRHTCPLVVRTHVDGRDVVVERSAAPPYGTELETHLAVHEDARNPHDLARADVLVREGPPDDPRFGGADRWAAETLRHHPQCALAAYVSGRETCTVRVRDVGAFELTTGADADLDPAAAASALHAWLVRGGVVPEGGTRLRVHVADGVHSVEVRPATWPGRTGPGDR
ncbi:hypothetical protein [Streptomyces sp. AJS327]|uniref:hypothetical protein n=1 Tax=Streptomyces sp. AJS327 TaxID=2545265 RepID=UPI0035B544B4